MSVEKFDAKVALGADIERFVRGMSAAGKHMQSTAVSFAASAAKMVAAAASLAGGFALHSLIKGGMEYNVLLEQGQNQVAATLRLYDHLSPGVDATADAAAKFTANLREAEVVQKRLVKIADESPGDYEQVSRMFQSMLPAARAITGDMEQIMDLTQKTTLFAGVTGDFDLAGSQMGMMLGGAAGQEMQMWRLLKPSFAQILEAEKKVKKGASSADITKAFNQALTPAERLEYTMKALGSLGPEVAEHFGNSWDGVTGQATSRIKELKANFTKGLYNATKEWLADVTTGEGVLSTGGGGFKQLMAASEYAGLHLDAAAGWFYGKVTKAVNFLVTHWQPLIDGMARAFTTGLNAAKMFLAAKVAQGAAGGLWNLGKAAMSFGGSTLPKLAAQIAGMGTAALTTLPAMALLGAAMAGAVVIFGGIAAYFIEHWDQLIGGIADGTVTLAPVFDTIDLLWAKLVALGSVFLAGTDVAGGLQDGITGVAGIFTAAISTMSAMVKITAYFSMTMGGLYNTFQLVAIGFNLVITGILAGIKWLLDSVNDWIGSEALASASGSMGNAMEALERDRDRRADTLDMTMTKKLFAAAEAFDNATVDGAGITSNFRKTFEEGLGKLGKGEGGGMTKPKGPSVNIHNMNVFNDMRDQDPDRIMGTFVQKLEDVTMRPTQAVTLDENGA